MIKLADLVKEAKQVGTLYHHTTYANAIKIIETDSLCSSNSPYGEDVYAISFTRDQLFHGSLLSNEGGDECRLVINGDKLSERNKIQPHADSEWEPRAESEERIVKDHKFCIPILNYLKYIDLLTEPEDDLDELIELCEKKGIKVVKSF